MIILDFNIDDMHRSVHFATFIEKVCGKQRRREAVSYDHQANVEVQESPKNEHAPSHTASKHLSSQVMTTSATFLLSCHRSGANLIFLFLSSMFRIPFAVYSFSSFERRSLYISS